MADKSLSEVIKASPVRRGLDAFRNSFTFACHGFGVATDPASLDQIGNEG